MLDTAKIGLTMEWIYLSTTEMIFGLEERHFLIPWNLDITEKDQKLEIFKEEPKA